MKASRKTYQRLYKRKRRRNAAFRRKEVDKILVAQRKFRAKNRTKWNADRRRWDKQSRQRTVKRLGRVCRFPRCGRRTGLHVHHDHKKQQRLGCCRSENGCVRCQLCMLCSQHNHLLGMVNDSLRVAKRVVAFLRRYH